jgi:hypothetical protein
VSHAATGIAVRGTNKKSRRRPRGAPPLHHSRGHRGNQGIRLEVRTEFRLSRSRSMPTSIDQKTEARAIHCTKSPIEYTSEHCRSRNDDRRRSGARLCAPRGSPRDRRARVCKGETKQGKRILLCYLSYPQRSGQETPTSPNCTTRATLSRSTAIALARVSALAPRSRAIRRKHENRPTCDLGWLGPTQPSTFVWMTFLDRPTKTPSAVAAPTKFDLWWW